MCLFLSIFDSGSDPLQIRRNTHRVTTAMRTKIPGSTNTCIKSTCICIPNSAPARLPASTGTVPYVWGLGTTGLLQLRRPGQLHYLQRGGRVQELQGYRERLVPIVFHGRSLGYRCGEGPRRAAETGELARCAQDFGPAAVERSFNVEEQQSRLG